MIRRAEFDALIWQWPSWQAWQEYVARMGFDANVVTIPGWIEADDEARTISAHCYVREDENPNQIKVVVYKGVPGAVRAIAVIQLESPALPFPETFGLGYRAEGADWEPPAGTLLGFP